MSIRIECVKTKKDWRDFLKLQFRIYEGNPYWVPPLLSEVKETLDSEKNPFWKHARKEIFLAKQNDRFVGRIVAVVDENHNNFHQERTGFFGFFECIKDFEVAQSLWDEAKRWLKINNMDIMRGPVNPSMNDECAFLLEGFDKPPTVMMPYTQPYYLNFAEQYGFKKAKDLYALLKKAEDGIPERIERMVEVVKKKTGVKICPFNMKNFERDVQFLKNIYNSAWEKNWGFVPMTDAEMDLSAKKLKQFADPELILFAEIDNKPVGVSVTIPDINQVLKMLNGRLGPIEVLKFLYYKRKIDGVRSLIGGVKKEYRNTGIIAVLYYETEKAVVRLGYKWCELGWNLEDNDLINQFDMAIGGKIYKKYRIYEMKI
ncbi:MAG: hypothetical protein COY53_01555 [Elusimicrobia bacterium CG_4_10_14_0_8_um_filter_37_32]|nr:MAG: hypothetical protein COS17_08250 [Elusimicrobia bacterium CG02_land_8_20_14_3_00_37_13]PIZ14067.1 MAG: hypothetical protein COY53_01555 [Elusimicrobia bacterium CG_4_10_14_0_8_um_filter_37_32]